MPSQMKEGWGLTHDDEKMYASDGTPHIYVIRPDTFTVEKTLSVSDSNGRYIDRLNELEFIGNNMILSNKWLTDEVYKIDLSDGKVVTKYDLGELK